MVIYDLNFLNIDKKFKTFGRIFTMQTFVSILRGINVSGHSKQRNKWDLPLFPKGTKIFTKMTISKQTCLPARHAII